MQCIATVILKQPSKVRAPSRLHSTGHNISWGHFQLRWTRDSIFFTTAYLINYLVTFSLPCPASCVVCEERARLAVQMYARLYRSVGVSLQQVMMVRLPPFTAPYHYLFNIHLHELIGKGWEGGWSDISKQTFICEYKTSRIYPLPRPRNMRRSIPSTMNGRMFVVE